MKTLAGPTSAQVRLVKEMHAFGMAIHPSFLPHRSHSMIHYTCDRCQRVMDSCDEPRYVVQIEVQVVTQTPSVDDESIDHLSDLNEMLHSQSMMSADNDPDDALDTLEEMLLRGEVIDDHEALTSTNSLCGADEEENDTVRNFDLCPQCYARYSQNPLSRQRSLSMHFSDN